ncbi:MAG: chromosome segregation protein SMC [Clostridiaceae bacterium]|nr:chromosome segregation protein SMC [Clostridiaceae bacterium]
MYLKSIEIQGFKSFANKILFEFHNGITGIVGPNGSGKSNVADAVRWVLGEQRVKQLRGGSMQDVIFAGTQLRKPQGFAYVAITLDNSDHKLPVSFDEVTISRRLYRSGESEYKINGSPCRLKDINEMFYDTGIGKEGYSIIGQGQIDKILSGRPEERRELFDEAAGIVKFKRRKLIAQKKLEDEKQNLIRVTDILSELEKQVGPLKKQSEAAREYLRLRDSLKSYDANLFLTESAALRTQISSLEEKEGIVSGDLESVRGASRQLKEEYESVSRALEQLEEEINGKREAVSQSGLVRQGLEGRINVLNEQINTERLNEEHIRSRITAIDAELAKKGEQKASYEQEKNGLSGEIAEIMSALSEAEARLKDKDTSIAATEQQMEEAKAAIIAALNEKAGLAARRQRYETMLEQVDVRRAELSQKLLKSKSEESVQEEQLKETQQQLSDLLEQLQQLSERETALTEEVSAAEEEVRRLNKLLNNTQQEYHTGYTKLESLRNLAERYDGYGGSIRRVMEVRDRIFGIHGVVADIVSTEKKYETAIETALGGSIQNIVTDSEQTAKQLIEYLKKNRYGRATFLPLTSMKHSQAFSQPAALKEPGVLGLASSLVKAEKEYGGLVEYLLGRVVVVDHIDHAIALAKKFRYSLRIVTLDGELLSAGGSMTGGAFKNSSNLLGRRREIEELEAQCKKALVKVDSIQKDLVLNEGILEEARENLVLVKEDIQKKRISENTIRIKMRQLEEKKQEIAESATDLVLENEELEEQLRELRGNREQLLSEAGQLERLGEEKDQETRKAAAILEQLKTEREQCAVSLSEVQLSASRIRQRDSFIGENIRRVSEEEAALLDERSRLEQGSTGSGESIAAREAQIASLWEEIQKETKQAEILETAMQELLQKKEEQAGRQKGFFDKKEELSQRMNLLDRDLLRLQNQREKLSERLEASVQYMWNEYELTYSLAEKLQDPELTSVPEMKKIIEGLKTQIRNLGHVNVNSIEDYKEVSERYEFMKTQHDDLAAAEAALLKIIEELDTGMRRQFEEKFKEIREEFDTVFKELFGGGHGTLELSEDEDILEAGIQIISQPPGKKLQNMMQLSGGEKALTAIALLFAIQNLKPSPFCLLDEIEAALDDSNVDRFAGYLHKLTKYTQFIVITHRRGTMVSADRLYGITMQEKGVSTLVSVSLIEAELDK